MAPAKKTRRQSKTPAKLDEFLCEDVKDKEHEPRRSGRTPKLSERLKNYMDDQSSSGREKSFGQMTYQMKIDHQVAHQLLGTKLKEPKVVLKALPKSFLQKGTRKYPAYRREPRVTLKRLTNLNLGTKRSSRVCASKLHKQRTRLSSSFNSQATAEKKDTKIKMEHISSTQNTESQQKKRERSKAVNYEIQPKPSAKRRCVSSNTSKPKIQESNVKKETGKHLQLDPDIMNELLHFGAKVEEALAMNDETVCNLTRISGEKKRSHGYLITDRFEDIDHNEVDKILTWLEEEERQRREYRRKMLESLRVSHKTNMAMYTHMLSVLKSVTASV